MAQFLNPLVALDSIKNTYRNYVSSFQEFKNPVIKAWVEEKVKDENLLYKGPFIQLNKRFEMGTSFEELVDRGILHTQAPTCFTTDPGNPQGPVVDLYKHQSEAICSITSGRNTIISTGTGSGKSFCFGIPVISKCLEMQDESIKGIKAIVVYPMNALANSQYDEFAKRLDGSGLKIAIYTGDTPKTRLSGLDDYRARYGREPFDSELLSREEIQNTPPDILITNYVMLEYILTRFEDRVLFPSENKGVLKFLVLDEIHTYTGKKGADVAYLIRRLKQSTGTKGLLRCIGTSATVQDTDGADSSIAITKFASELFGESFEPEAVIGEHYIKLPHDPDALLPSNILVTEDMVSNFEDTDDNIREIVTALTGGPLPTSYSDSSDLGSYLGKQKTIQFLENSLLENICEYSELIKKYNEDIRPDYTYKECELEISAAFLAGMYTKVNVHDKMQARLIPKIHTFFSQGRDIKSCISPKAPHLNDAGEITCPHCAREGKKDYKTFPLVFCRSCGQEYYSVQIEPDGTVIPHELGEEETSEGTSVYLYPGEIGVDKDDLPENWITEKKRDIKAKYRDSIQYEKAQYCPNCNMLYKEADKSHPPCICPDKVTVTIIPHPFMYCPSHGCGIYYDRRVKKEFNKLFSFSTVGRSTATDVLVASTLNNLPDKEKKIIAFTDNRQDTALQAAHVNNIQKKMHFRRGLYHALSQQEEPVPIDDLRDLIYDVFDKNDSMPDFAEQELYGLGRSKSTVNAYKDYLLFNTYLELGSSKQKTQPNLEDMGLLKVSYVGMEAIAANDEFWDEFPPLFKASKEIREDYLTGFLDIMRYNLAVGYEYLQDYQDFYQKVINKLQPVVLFHNEVTTRKPIGYSDDAKTKNRDVIVFRLTHSNGNLVKWTKRALSISDTDIAVEIVNHVAEKFQDLKRLNSQTFHHVGKLWFINPEVIQLSVPDTEKYSVCKKCGKIHYFNELNYCTGPNCSDMTAKFIGDKYFRKEYTKQFSETIFVNAEEHSGQIDGDTRKDLEVRFKNGKDVNVIVCTPTMELGIDIGSLSAVYMRNVPPSPSNYAQRAGRAGRKSQSSLISTFCGVGMKRGPHDQYFYRYPKQIISGKISVPRFMLDNQILVRSHIHSLIIESLSLKIPQTIGQIINMEKIPALPMFSDIEEDLMEETIDKSNVEGIIRNKREEVINTIKKALESEISAFDWFTQEYIENIVDNFVTDLDKTFNPFRKDYVELTTELKDLDIHIRSATLNKQKRRVYTSRRESIENKVAKMQSGSEEYATYSYLAENGFIPNYGFPTLTTKLSLSQRSGKIRVDKDLIRDQAKAIREYAPGNSIYYKGNRYAVTEARFKTLDNKIETSKLLICPQCGVAYLDDPVIGGCCHNCEADVTDVPSFNNAMRMVDQRAIKRNGITSDEEERQKLGYKISSHYRMSDTITNYEAVVDDQVLMTIAYDHNGKILEMNEGPLSRTDDYDVNGFTLCTACNRWITSHTQLKAHLDSNNPNKCWKGATKEDIVENIVLYTQSNHDVITVDCEPPDDIKENSYESFYISLSVAIMQSLQITMNIDVDELNSFLMPHPEYEDRSAIIIYEAAEGGVGILKALQETDTFRNIMKEARKILHEFDSPDKACQKACYLCLCNYYNQRFHEKLDRNIILPTLNRLSGATVRTAGIQVHLPGDSYEQLSDMCDSTFEKAVLEKIKINDVPLPTHAQFQIENNGVVIAKPDFVYTSGGRSIAVFADGPAHNKPSVQKDDETKRTELDLMGWDVFVIRDQDDMEKKIEELKKLTGSDY